MPDDNALADDSSSLDSDCRAAAASSLNATS
jgi:hypothetical protein